MSGGHNDDRYPHSQRTDFAALGVLIFVIAFSLVIRLAPINLWKEIAQERNIAAAILAGAVALGICWIIAATMH